MARTPTTLVLWVLVAAACTPSATSSAAQVVSVVDGDSLVVDRSGETLEIRLVGINAPEHDECFGPEARSLLAEAVAGMSVTVRPLGTDRFGRTLARVFVGGRDVAAAQVEAGAALALSGDRGEARRLIGLEERARDEGRGLWSPDVCGAVGPVPEVSVTRVVANPPGPDEDRLDDEWVEIRAEATVDLSGWVLRDESSEHRFRFPDGTTLPAGRRLRITTGCGGVDGVLAWCADGPVWNNDGDSVLLLDRWGRVVAHRRIGGG